MPASKRTFVLSLLAETFAICRLAPDAAVPEWATQGQFFSITRTSDELSVIAEMALVPERLRTAVNWRVMKVHGPFDFAEVGILASLLEPLAAASVTFSRYRRSTRTISWCNPANCVTRWRDFAVQRTRFMKLKLFLKFVALLERAQ